MTILIGSIQYEVSEQLHQGKKREVWKEPGKVKRPLLFHTENAQDSTQVLWELMNELSKTGKYKASMQNSITRLQINMNLLIMKLWKWSYSWHLQENKISRNKIWWRKWVSSRMKSVKAQWRNLKIPLSLSPHQCTGIDICTNGMTSHVNGLQQFISLKHIWPPKHNPK